MQHRLNLLAAIVQPRHQRNPDHDWASAGLAHADYPGSADCLLPSDVCGVRCPLP